LIPFLSRNIVIRLARVKIAKFQTQVNREQYFDWSMEIQSTAKLCSAAVRSYTARIRAPILKICAFVETRIASPNRKPWSYPRVWI